MTVYFFSLAGVIVVYVLSLVILMIGWRRSRQSETERVTKDFPRVTVVVAVRNEADHLDALLESLAQQNYPNVEVIIVDDHSEDETRSIAQLAFAADKLDGRLLLLPPDRQGKKAALTEGITHATGAIIVTTDGDCTMESSWLQKLVAPFEHQAIQMVIGHVTLAGTGWWHALQALEFSSVMAVTFGFAGWKKPVMCNGANLAFRKSAFEAVNGYSGHAHLSSGDDEFLMRNILHRFPESVSAVSKAIVKTQSAPSLRTFWHQRIRWASKWKHNTSWLAKGVAAAIWLSQLAWMMVLIGTVQGGTLWWLLGAFKLVADVVFFSVIGVRWESTVTIFSFFLLEIFYPVYVLAIGLLSFRHRTKWKGRPVR